MVKRGNRERELSEAQERYVECIADAERNHGHAHISLLADSLGVRKPSVVQMTTRLEDKGIIKRNDKEVVLTRFGRGIAGELRGRHALLQAFMIKILEMDIKKASQEACRLEHAVSNDFMRGIRILMEKQE